MAGHSWHVTFMLFQCLTSFCLAHDHSWGVTAPGLLSSNPMPLLAGANGNVKSVIFSAPALFVFCLVQIGVHLGLILAAGKLMRFSRRDCLVASNANVGGEQSVQHTFEWEEQAELYKLWLFVRICLVTKYHNPSSTSTLQQRNLQAGTERRSLPAIFCRNQKLQRGKWKFCRPNNRSWDVRCQRLEILCCACFTHWHLWWDSLSAKPPEQLMIDQYVTFTAVIKAGVKSYCALTILLICLLSISVIRAYIGQLITPESPFDQVVNILVTWIVLVTNNDRTRRVDESTLWHPPRWFLSWVCIKTVWPFRICDCHLSGRIPWGRRSETYVIVILKKWVAARPKLISRDDEGGARRPGRLTL